MTHKQFIQAFCIHNYEIELGEGMDLIDYAEDMWDDIEEHFVKKEQEKEQEIQKHNRDYITF